MNRRRFLALGGTVAVAGCSRTGGESGAGDGTTGTTESGPTATATATEDGGTLDSHPAARNLDAQPTLGPDPAEATGVIVAFEDPSCPRCQAFERQVVPKIRSDLVEPGAAAFVFRGYPVVYPWGEPATRALEATYAADAGAHWTLADHYFANPDDFQGEDAATVYDRTETFLAAETDLDATAIVDAAREGDADAAVETDLDAGRAAGAGRTTPHVFLFRDGTYLTKAAGSIGFDVIASALQL